MTVLRRVLPLQFWHKTARGGRRSSRQDAAEAATIRLFSSTLRGACCLDLSSPISTRARRSRRPWTLSAFNRSGPRSGRKVIGNLTTVTTSLADFEVVLVGYHFAEQLAEKLGPGSEISSFIKWEQLAAYARAKVLNDRSFRGQERVRKRLSERGTVPISDEPSAQILASQKTYGLWGLYTSAARTSELLDDSSPPRLTPIARHLVKSSSSSRACSFRGSRRSFLHSRRSSTSTSTT